MATYTTNYNLTKPELSDTISPTVFANNFDTIDTTLKTISDNATSPYIKLKDVTVNSSVMQVDISMTDVDMDDYLELHLVPFVNVQCYLRINNVSSSGCGLRVGSNESNMGYIDRHASQYNQRGNRTILRQSYGHIVAIHQHFYTYNGTKLYASYLSDQNSGATDALFVTSDVISTLSSINICAYGSTFPIGDRFLIYGLKY